MKFRPLHDRVVVKRIDAEEKTTGGIIIPDTAKEKPSQGEVVAVGPGGRDEAGKLIPIDIKVGDRVLFSKWSGTEVKIDGQELLIMKKSDIMGVISRRPRKRPRNEYAQPHSSSFAARGLRRARPNRHRRDITWLPRKFGRCTRSNVARDRHARPRGTRNAGSERPECRARQVVWRAAYYQG